MIEIAKRFDLKIVSIEDLIKYRLQTESLIERLVDVELPTQFGDFKITAFKSINTNEEHLALYKGTWAPDEPVLVRVHSSCMTGDIFGSCRCDCAFTAAQSDGNYRERRKRNGCLHEPRRSWNRLNE